MDLVGIKGHFDASDDPCRSRQPTQRGSVQCSCKKKLSADGHAEGGARGARVSSDEERKSEAKEEDGSGSTDGLVTERKDAVLQWEVLAKNRAVWVQFYKKLGLGAGGLGSFGLVRRRRRIYPPAVAWAEWSGRCWLRVHCRCAALLVLC
jgi:hypothetical protein